MGIYLNRGNEKFFQAVNSEIYVDKSDLITYLNKVLRTQQKFVCVSRPRRFGKSMAADMLTAYYSRGCDSQELFAGLKAMESESFFTHLNQYDVISLNMQDFLSQSAGMEEMLSLIEKSILWELLSEYPDCRYFDKANLTRTMQDIYQDSRRPFIVIIDEWDCVFREYREHQAEQDRYLDFLRNFMKDREYIYLAYMTGILPIKKYGTHSALNMFNEFSMTNPGLLAEYVGFTEQEVEALCTEYGQNIEELKEWYNGYRFERAGAVYNPRSVVQAVLSGICDTYWNRTESFESLRIYIDMNFEGIRDDVLRMMAGESVPVNTGSFVNDMVTFNGKDDVFTLLVHLGYLGYDFAHESVFIPNNEIKKEFVTAVAASDWGEASRALKCSAETLQAIWDMRTAQVAEGIEQAHFETSHIQYNDENALSYTISLALYAARNFYTVYRELPSGKGFADIVYIPRKKYQNKPALVVELKWNKSAQGAIEQIKRKEYCKSLEEYTGNILLVGINYDKESRKHECIIESDKKEKCLSTLP